MTTKTIVSLFLVPIYIFHISAGQKLNFFPSNHKSKQCIFAPEIVLAQDTSESFQTDINNLVDAMPAVFEYFADEFPHTRFGIVQFGDTEICNMRHTSESVCAKVHQRLDSQAATSVEKTQKALRSLRISQGNDPSENFVDAIVRTALSKQVGWSQPSKTTIKDGIPIVRIIFASANAVSHEFGDKERCRKTNRKTDKFPEVKNETIAQHASLLDEDANSGCDTLEYSSFADMKSALEERNIQLVLLLGNTKKPDNAGKLTMKNKGHRDRPKAYGVNKFKKYKDDKFMETSLFHLYNDISIPHHNISAIVHVYDNSSSFLDKLRFALNLVSSKFCSSDSEEPAITNTENDSNEQKHNSAVLTNNQPTDISTADEVFTDAKQHTDEVVPRSTGSTLSTTDEIFTDPKQHTFVIDPKPTKFIPSTTDKSDPKQHTVVTDPQPTNGISSTTDEVFTDPKQHTMLTDSYSTKVTSSTSNVSFTYQKHKVVTFSTTGEVFTDPKQHTAPPDSYATKITSSTANVLFTDPKQHTVETSTEPKHLSQESLWTTEEILAEQKERNTRETPTNNNERTVSAISNVFTIVRSKQTTISDQIDPVSNPAFEIKQPFGTPKPASTKGNPGINGSTDTEPIDSSAEAAGVTGVVVGGAAGGAAALAVAGAAYVVKARLIYGNSSSTPPDEILTVEVPDLMANRETFEPVTGDLFA